MSTSGYIEFPARSAPRLALPEQSSNFIISVEGQLLRPVSYTRILPGIQDILLPSPRTKSASRDDNFSVSANRQLSRLHSRKTQLYIFYYKATRLAPAHLFAIMERGEDALAGKEEKDIPSHRFPPTSQDRTIHFKGEYILIVNQETDRQVAFEEVITEYRGFEVPAGYTCYVRGATIYFDIKTTLQVGS
ncbi:hypothetical protein VE03_03800 [Pseudogymnoascus sp. 23342-1-I1]|nr:hypothetical protein VE03_03800 [Pseudogymnoascus sp. 23342-1-I1]